MNNNLHLFYIITFVVFSSFCFAQDNGQYNHELNNNCFIANSQVQVPGQIDYNVLPVSNQNFVSNENILFLQNNQKMLAVSQSNDTITLQFFSEDEEDAKSQIEYVNSIGLIKPQIDNEAQIIYLQNQECKELLSNELYLYAMNTIPNPNSRVYESRNFVADDTGAGAYGKEIAQSSDMVQSVMHSQEDLGNLKTLNSSASLAKENVDVQTDKFGLDSILISIFFGSALTLFFVVVAVHFRGQFFRPLEYSQELTLGKTQLEILEQLEDNAKIPTDIASQIKKSKSTTIEHLEALQSMGLVQKVSEPGKKFVYYKLTQSARQILLRKKSSGVAI